MPYLDLSFKTDLDFLGLLQKEKCLSYNWRNRICLIGIYDVCNIQLFCFGAFRTSGTANSNCMKKGYGHVCVRCFILHWVCQLLVAADWLSSKEFLQCLNRFSFYERWESQHEILDFWPFWKGPPKRLGILFCYT